MENSLTYFISDIVLFFGIILFSYLSFPKHTNKKPGFYISISILIIAFALLGFLPFCAGAFKLSNLNNLLQNLISFTPFEDYSLAFLHGSVLITPLHIFEKFIITLSSLIVLILSFPFIKKLNQKTPKFILLFLITILAGYGAIISNDFISLFIALEIISISVFAMIACFNDAKDKQALTLEAGVKYFILNLVSSAFMLFGISYIYLTLGTINFSDINTMIINKILPNAPLLNLGEILFFMAFTFKIGAFPFYIWVMDTFKGSNYSMILFVSTTIQSVFVFSMVKPAACLGYFGSLLSFALILCAIITIITGGLLMVRTLKKEGTIKDFLSACAILNTGYIFSGIAFLTKGTISAGIFYTLVYLIAAFGIFSGMMLLVRNLKKLPKTDNIYGENLCKLKGISYISPFFAIMLSICLLSLAGFPVMAGFSAKFYLYTEILRSGIWAVYPLLFAAFGGIISIYSYFKIIFCMLQKPENFRIYKRKPAFDKFNTYTFTLSLCAVYLILGFFLFAPLIELIQNMV